MIQEIKMPDYGKVISIQAIAQLLNSTAEDLSESLDVLLALYYIRYTDKLHKSIFLTESGKYTIVPM